MAATGRHAWAQRASTPIRMLVGYPPGGPADLAARIIATELGILLGAPVIVENRPGAGGQIAARELKTAPADGSVLFLTNTHTVGMLPLTLRQPGFDPATDFQPLGAIASFELALAVHPKTDARDLAALGQWFTRHAADASIGVPAPASAPEFIAAALSKTLDSDTVPVAYKGAAPLVQDLLGGQIAAGVSGISDFLQHHKTGRLRILAVTGATALLPDVPAFSRAGVAGIDLSDFQGLYAPAALPAPVAQRINVALNQVLARPDVQNKLQAQAMAPLGGPAQAHAQRLSQVRAGLARLVKDSGYQPQ